MPTVVAMGEIPPERVNRPGSTGSGSPGAKNTTFFRASTAKPDAPTAALNRYEGCGQSRYSAASPSSSRPVPSRVGGYVRLA
jgi:hypothetical protein